MLSCKAGGVRNAMTGDYDLFSSGGEGNFDTDVDDHWEGT